MESSSIKRTSIDLKQYSRENYIDTQTRNKRKKQTKRQNWKARNKTDCKKRKKTKSVIFFCLQNKNESGSGDVVSAPKRKTFSRCKKKMFWE